MIMLNENLILWRSKETPKVTLSTTKSKYVTLCEYTKELIFITNLIEFIYIKIEKLMIIHSDSSGSIALANIEKITLQNKHIDA
jgi:hypothetical protein